VSQGAKNLLLSLGGKWIWHEHRSLPVASSPSRTVRVSLSL
jgi:hypothetical protein